MHLHLHGRILLLAIAAGHAHAYSITAEHANSKSGSIASSEVGSLIVGDGPSQSSSGSYSKSQSASFASAGESSFSFHGTGDKLGITPEMAGSLQQNYYVGAPGCNQKACNPRGTQMNMVTDSYDEGDDGQYHEKEAGQYPEDDGQYHGEYQEKDESQYQEDLGQYQEHDDGQYRDPFVNQEMMKISNIPVPVHTPYFNMPASGGQFNGDTMSQSSHYGGGFGGPPGILSPYDKRIPANEAPNPKDAEMNKQIGNRMQAADIPPPFQSIAPIRPMTLGGFDGPPGILSPYDIPVPANNVGDTQKIFNNPPRPMEPNYVPNKPGKPNRHNLPPFIPPQGLPTVPPNQPAVHYDGDHDGKTGVLIAVPYHPQGPPKPQQEYAGNPTTPQVQYTGGFDGSSEVLRPLEPNSGTFSSGVPDQGYSHGSSPNTGSPNIPYTGDFGGAPGVLKPFPGAPSQGTPPQGAQGAPGYQTNNPNQHGINQIPGAPNIPSTDHFNGPPGILKPPSGLPSQGTPATPSATPEYPHYNPNQYGPKQTPGAPNVQYTSDFNTPPGMSIPSPGIPSRGLQPTPSVAPVYQPNNTNQYGPNQTPPSAAPGYQSNNPNQYGPNQTPPSAAPGYQPNNLNQYGPNQTPPSAAPGYHPNNPNQYGHNQTPPSSEPGYQPNNPKQYGPNQTPPSAAPGYQPNHPNQYGPNQTPPSAAPGYQPNNPNQYGPNQSPPSAAPGYQPNNPNQYGPNQTPPSAAPGYQPNNPNQYGPNQTLPSAAPGYQPNNPNQYGPNQTPPSAAPGYQPNNPNPYGPNQTPPSAAPGYQSNQSNNPNQYGHNQTPGAPDVQFTGDFNAPPGILKPSTSNSPETHRSRPAQPKQPGYSHSVNPTSDTPNIPYTGDFGGAPGILKPSPETQGTSPGPQHYNPIQPGYANGAYPSPGPDAPNTPYTGDFGGAPGILNPSPETSSHGPYKPNVDGAPGSLKPGLNSQQQSSELPTYRPSPAPGSQSYEPSKPDYSHGLVNPTPATQFNTATAPEKSKPSELGGQENPYAFPPNYSDYNQFGGPSTHGKPSQTPEYGNNVEKPLGTLQPPKFNSPNQESQHGEGGLSRNPSLKPTGDSSPAYNQGQFSTTPSHIEYTGDFGGPAGILRPNVPPNFPPRVSPTPSTPGNNENSGRTPFDQPTSYSHTIAVPVVPDSLYGGQPAYGRSAGKDISKLPSDNNPQAPDYTPQKPGSCSGDFCSPKPENGPENPTTANDNGFDTPKLKQSQDTQKQTACEGNTCEAPVHQDSTKPETLPRQPNQQRTPQKPGYTTSFDTPQERPKPPKPSSPKSIQCNGDDCGSESSPSNTPNKPTTYPNTITVPVVPNKQDSDDYTGPTSEPKSERPTYVGKPHSPGYSSGFDNPKDPQCSGNSCGIPNGPHSDKIKPIKPDERNLQKPKPSGYENPQEILKDVQKPTQCVGDFCGLPTGPDYSNETPGKSAYSGTSQSPAYGSGFDKTRGTSIPTPPKDIQKPAQCNGDSCELAPDTEEDLKTPLDIPINNQDTDGPTAKPKSKETPRRQGSDHPKDQQKSHLGKCTGDSCEIGSDSDDSLNKEKYPQPNKPADQTTTAAPVVSDMQDTGDYGTESKEIAHEKPGKTDGGKAKPGSGNPTQCSGTSCVLGPDLGKSEKTSPTDIPKRGNKKPDRQCVGDCGGILSLPEDDYTDEFDNDDQQQQQQQWGDDIQYTEGFPCTGDCSNDKNANTDKSQNSDRETDKSKSPNCLGNDCPAPKPKQTLELPIADSEKDDSSAKADEFYNSFVPAPAPSPVSSDKKKPEVDSQHAVQANDDEEEFSNRDQSAVYDQQIQEGGCDGGDCQENVKSDKQTKLNDYDSVAASSDVHAVGCSGGCPQVQQGISNGFAFAGTRAGSFVGGNDDNHVLNKLFSGINSALGLSSSSGSYAYSGSHASAGAFTGTGGYGSRPHRSARRFFYFF